jgi:hypothetical protein
MNYEVFKEIDKRKDKSQLVEDLSELRKKHEEVKMILNSEKQYIEHFKLVVEVKDKTIETILKINDDFLIENCKLRNTIKKLSEK